MNAKQRRIEKRRLIKRNGLTERQYRTYQSARRDGYSHDAAMDKAGRRVK